jgi:FdhE protein
LDAARTRWTQVRREQPEVVPALPLHQALLSAQIELVESLAASGVPAPGVAAEAVLDSLNRGIPAFGAAAVPGILASAVPWLGRFTDALATGGAGAAAAKVGSALAGGLVDPLALLAASWRRDSEKVAELTGGLGLNLQVTWLSAELASAPFAHWWQEALLESAEPVREAVARWDRGDCPACGAWPSMAEYFLGERLNRCAYCAAAWPFSAPRCTYCGEAGEGFRVVVGNKEHPGRRLELCRACGGYLKTIDVGRPIPFPLLAIEDLASQDLDRAAQHHGFRRTPLRTQPSK